MDVGTSRRGMFKALENMHSLALQLHSVSVNACVSLDNSGIAMLLTGLQVWVALLRNQGKPNPQKKNLETALTMNWICIVPVSSTLFCTQFTINSVWLNVEINAY